MMIHMHVIRYILTGIFVDCGKGIIKCGLESVSSKQPVARLFGPGSILIETSRVLYPARLRIRPIL